MPILSVTLTSAQVLRVASAFGSQGIPATQVQLALIIKTYLKDRVIAQESQTAALAQQNSVNLEVW